MGQGKIKIADIAATGTPSSSTYYRGDNTWATAPLPAGYNNTNWDTAYADRNKWDGGATGLTAATGRVSLGIDKITNLLNANYTALITDKVIATSIAFTAARTVTLPAANSVNAGYELIIADLFGTITSTNTLIIAITGTDTINEATSVFIGAAYGMRRLFSDGISKWTLDAGVMRISDYIGTTLTANKAVITDANSKLAPSVTTAAEIGYVSGVTSSIQTQLNSKQSTLGLHIPYLAISGKTYSLAVNGTALATIAGTSNTIKALLFLPMRTVTCSSLQINITISIPTALARILIYSDLNGVPDQKLYESANLDCSTTGIKTATTTQTFVAGTSYWICVHNGTTTTPTYSAYTTASLPSLYTSTTPSIITSYLSTVTFGSAPQTFGTPSASNSTTPYVGITI